MMKPTDTIRLLPNRSESELEPTAAFMLPIVRELRMKLVYSIVNQRSLRK
ncbi:MAG: hypothetical protein QG670_2894 [Thermoproteota archaeon]|nr:hypothetical protein [Thermoproteota archaeon]